MCRKNDFAKFNDIDISYIYGGVTSFNGIGGHYGDKNLPLILETDEAFNTFKDIQISKEKYLE